MSSGREKDQSIETLRGVAVLLMVIGHVIGHTAEEGMKLLDGHILRYINESLVFLRMPLFTVISGYVYGLRPLRTDKIGLFINSKIRRLLFPLITVGSMAYLLQSSMPGTNKTVELHNIWHVWIFGYAQFWYLQALMLVFLFIGIAEYHKLLSDIRGYIGLLILSVALLLTILPLADYYGIVNIFAFRRFLFLMPFFLLGLGLIRFPWVFENKIIRIAAVILFCTGISLQQLSIFNYLEFSSDPTKWLGILVGFSGILIVFLLRRPIPFLAKLGFFSFSIFLFHIFGIVASRILLTALQLDHPILFLLIGALSGVLLPIIAEKYLHRYHITKIYILGEPIRNT